MAPPRVERWAGLLRSLAVYWRPGRQRGLRQLYRPWVGPGDLVFDVGAHVGDRATAFSARGAQVVALEPQPEIRRWLVRLVGGRPGVTIRSEAVGSAPGTAQLAVSHRTPTVSSLAERWTTALPEANPSFRQVRWEDTVEVSVTTLDALIGTYGMPRFCKIDVEGFEVEVLTGLSRPLPGLSFEFVAGALDVPIACVQRLEALGRYELNAVRGEERRFVSERWLSPTEMVRWLERGAGGAPSGDVYARLLAPASYPSAGRLDG